VIAAAPGYAYGCLCELFMRVRVSLTKIFAYASSTVSLVPSCSLVLFANVVLRKSVYFSVILRCTIYANLRPSVICLSIRWRNCRFGLLVSTCLFFNWRCLSWIRCVIIFYCDFRLWSLVRHSHLNCDICISMLRLSCLCCSLRDCATRAAYSIKF